MNPPRRGSDDGRRLTDGTTDRRRAMVMEICAAQKSASGFLKPRKSASDHRRKLALRRLPSFPSPKLTGLELRLQAARQLSGWQRFTLAARRNGCPPRPVPHCVWNNAHHRELMCQNSVKSISATNLDFVETPANFRENYGEKQQNSLNCHELPLKSSD